MKKRKWWKKLLALALAAAVAATSSGMSAKADGGSETDYTQYVDPFVCTDVDYGQQFPGAVSPYGIVKLSPDTYPHETNDHAGYDYSKNRISGFSHTRIEGVGGQGAGGDVLVTPTYVSYTAKPTLESRAQSYSHDKEQAQPGYYEVELVPNVGTDTASQDSSFGNIKAEMTASTRTGMHRYTFPKEGDVNLVVDLNYTYHGTDIRDAVMDVSTTEDGRACISGRFSGHNVSGHGRYTMYFYMETDKPVSDIHTWNGQTLGTTLSLTGNDLGAVLTFHVKEGETVQVKTAISPISAGQAQIDMEAENASWDFDKVREDAKNSWNDLLGRVEVETTSVSDPDGSLKKMFYTMLYRLFMTPVNATSTSGTYRGTNGVVYKAEGYTHYDSWTLWDDFRKYPIIGLIAPDIYQDIIQSVADMLASGISTWGNDHQPVPTVRNEHAVALLADGIAKGFTDIQYLDYDYGMVKSIAAMAVTPEVESLGYFPGRVDRTVEYAYDDWAISIIAKALGYTDEAEYYLNRSFNYKNLYKADAVNKEGTTMGLLWPKNRSGNWMSADPERYGDNGLYQGTLWQYTWWDTNDVAGLMKLMGGKENMVAELETLYGAKGESADGSRMLHSNTNEIDLQTPYLFNYAGKPSETQYWVRQIYTKETWNRYSGTGEYSSPMYTKVYNLSPAGYLETMDDDAGTMAAMYVAAAMGIFPMNPGSTTFQIGTPFFDKVTLHLGGGRTFVIKAQNVSPDNFYIQSASLYGSSLNRTWLDYSEIAAGGELDFTMGSSPSTWGEDGPMAPSASDDAPASAYDYHMTYDGTTITATDGVVDATVTATITDGASFSDDLGSVKAENLPDGLSMTCERKDDKKVALHLTGTIQNVSDETETFAVQIVMGDDAFKGEVKASQVENAVMSRMASIRIHNTMTPESLTVKAPDKTSYLVGERLDKTGGEVTISYKNTSYQRTLKLSSDELTVGAMPETAGDGQAVSVSYKNVSGSFAVDIHDVSAGDKGLILYYPFDSAENGVTKDESGNGWDGTLKNAAVAEDGTLLLDGSQKQYLDIPSGVFGGLDNDASISAWVKLDSASNNQMLLGAGVDKNAYYVLAMNNVIRSGLKTGSQDEKRTIASEGTQTARWVYLTYTLKDGKASLYLNGSKLAESDVEGHLSDVIKDGAFIHLGGIDFWNDPYTDGRISSLAVYNRALDEEEIKSEMSRTDTTLSDTLSEAETLMNQGGLSREEAQQLQQAMDLAQAYAGDGEKEKEAVDALCQRLDDLKSGISQSGSAYVTLEAENKDDWSGGSLKTETSHDDTSGGNVGNIGATYDGAWVKYTSRDFGSIGAASVSVRYCNNANRCGGNSKVEVYLDSMTGDPLVTVDLPETGVGWNIYQEVTAALPDGVTGVHDVYFVMHTGTNNARYVANFDWFSFTEKVNASSAHLEAENRSDWGWAADKAAMKTETSHDAEGASLVNVGNTFDGSWLKFSACDFTSQGMNEFSVRYCNNSSRCGSSNRVEIYLDSMDGDPVSTVQLPETGSSWSAYHVVKASLDTTITGTHDVYLKFRTEGGNRGYVANFDWFQFDRNDARGTLSSLAEEASKILQDKDRYNKSDIDRLQTAYDAAVKVLDKEDASTEEFENASSALEVALGRLHQKSDKTTLAQLLAQAAETDTSHWTEQTRKALEEAVSYGQEINGKEEPTNAEITRAVDQLQKALSGGVEQPEGDKRLLKAQISQALAIGPTGYTEDSYAALQSALESAQEVQNDRWASDDDIAAAIAGIQSAVRGLEEK